MNDPVACGRVVALSTSPARGTRKGNVPQVTLVAGEGLLGDAHAGPGRRQVSLLAVESIDRMRALGLDVGPGDFAENVTTAGIDLRTLAPGARLRIGGALLEVTQLGKECHDRCEIFRQAGDCVMPREGLFARVLEGGEVSVGAELAIEPGPTAGAQGDQRA